MALTKIHHRMIQGSMVNCLDFQNLVAGTDWSPAINAALERGSTVFLPAGHYQISSTLTVPSNTNFIMDGEATITATSPIYAMIQTSGEHRNGLITGGQLRCNPTGVAGNNMAQVGLWLRHVSMIRIRDVEIWDNNQYGILIGDTTTTSNFIYEVFMENLQIRRSLIPMPTNSHGVFWAEGGDCHMSDSIVMGQDYGVGGSTWNVHFDRVHVWTPKENGTTKVGFYISGGGNTLVQCQVDGPVERGIHLVGDDNTISHYKYLMPFDYNGTDNSAYAVWVEPGRRASIVNSFMSGGNSNFRIVAGIGGSDLSQITETGNITIYAVNAAVERSRSGARAYVRFWGTSPQSWAGMNIFSVTDNGTGDFTIHTAWRLPSANFVMTGTTDMSGAAVSVREIGRTVGVSSSVRIQVVDANGNPVDAMVQLVIHDLH